MTQNIIWFSSLFADHYDNAFGAQNAGRTIWVRKAFPGEVPDQRIAESDHFWFAAVFQLCAEQRTVFYFQEHCDFPTDWDEEEVIELFETVIVMAAKGEAVLGMRVVK
jgi:hypothetical protein